MRKILSLIGLIFLVGCSCLGQLPSKIIVGDTLSCQALIPDVMPYVTATANCSDVTLLYQVPEAGTPITQETILTVYAVTDEGVETTKDIRIVPVFLDSARITISADFFVYADQDVFDMFRITHAWIYNYPTRYLNAVQQDSLMGWMGWRNVTIPERGILHVSRWPMKRDERIANTEYGDLNGDLQYTTGFW